MPYDPNFIPGVVVPLPQASDKTLATAFNAGEFVHHLQFSLLFNQERGFATCAAHNIDGRELLESQQTRRSFRLDPKISPTTLQVDNDRGYSGNHNPWDRGHMARRKSLSWGNKSQAAIAERESDFYSNICPQHGNLHDDAWGNIEDWVLSRTRDDGGRASVFTGPVFTEEDPEIINLSGEVSIKIPAGFWKIIAIMISGHLRAAAFLVWQRDYDDPNPLPFTPVLEQVRITTIEVLTGLSFSALRRFDPLLFDRDREAITSDARIATAPAVSPFGSGSPLEVTEEALARISGRGGSRNAGGNIFSGLDIVL